MGKLIDEFKRGYEGSDPERFSVAGKKVTCPHCGGERFDDGEALLNTWGMTVLGLDWANQRATVLTCKRCGHVDWFATKPEAL